MPESPATWTPVSWPLLTLAAGDGDILGVFVWFAVAAVAALAGYYVVTAIRRWTQRDPRVETFTLQDMRDMRARGDISEREFGAMRAAMLARRDDEDDDPQPREGPQSTAHTDPDPSDPQDA